MKNVNETFTQVKTTLRKSKEFNGNEKLVLSYLIGFIENNQDIFITNDYLANENGLSTKTVNRMLVKFTELQLITYVYKGNNRTIQVDLDLLDNILTPNNPIKIDNSDSKELSAGDGVNTPEPKESVLEEAEEIKEDIVVTPSNNTSNSDFDNTDEVTPINTTSTDYSDSNSTLENNDTSVSKEEESALNLTLDTLEVELFNSIKDEDYDKCYSIWFNSFGFDVELLGDFILSGATELIEDYKDDYENSFLFKLEESGIIDFKELIEKLDLSKPVVDDEEDDKVEPKQVEVSLDILPFD